ncbi:hypothetical protein Cfor_12936 [Coptotermes formosanus]|uniref:Uncharacterized protein n=1 Tax=Coptotermes formosanus TaxID=36987 RepID=A0A6L2PFT6_COPFO|nr:hypothetical protein Cfor_12936 [Coptotermes formosanus]
MSGKLGNLYHDTGPGIVVTLLEASKCENVLVANVDKSRFKEQTVNIDVSTKEAPLVTPSVEWQQCQVADFSLVRQNLARYRSSCIFKPSRSLPGRRDEAGWYCLCFGSDNEPVESGASSGGIPPLLSILLSMNQESNHVYKKKVN